MALGHVYAGELTREEASEWHREGAQKMFTWKTRQTTVTETGGREFQEGERRKPVGGIRDDGRGMLTGVASGGDCSFKGEG